MKTLARMLMVIVAALAPGCETRESDAQKAYATPDAAVEALVAGLRTNSASTLRKALGPEAESILNVGDPVQARNDAATFLGFYDERHSIVTNEDGSATLLVGAHQWPLPIPLVQVRGGWQFDAERGAEEVANRRVGRNELAAIQVVRAIADAQEAYRAQAPQGDRAYAAKIFSDPHERNGLYWPGGSGEAPSPIGELVAKAAAEGYERGEEGNPRTYHGYQYRLLYEQGPAAPGGARSYMVDGKLTGGFGVIAWPAEYGQSGVMTFITNQLGVVYERDLGERTAAIAGTMEAFDPDPAWAVSEDMPIAR